MSQSFLCFYLHLFGSIQISIHCIFDREEWIGDVLGVGSLPKFRTQKIKNLRTVGVAILSRSLIEGHHSQATTLKTIHKCENISYFLLNIKGNVLQPT